MASEIFIFLLISASVVLSSSEKILVCYYGTWATYRWGAGRMDVEHINPDLCTHLVYSFVGINAQGTVVSLDSFLDLPGNRDNFGKFATLKNKNPKLKTILAVGGWNEGSGKYSIMAANLTLRQNFIQSALSMVKAYNFDGFDVDWEYPNRRDTVYGRADVDNFTQLLKELKEEFGKHGLLVTIAVSAVASSASLSYDVANLSKHVDYVSIMTYDMYGAWDPMTGHNAPLHIGEGDESADPATLYTVDMGVKYWLDAGCPPEKLIMGVPFYGRTFTLVDAYVNHVRAPARGVGIAGQFTGTNGFVGYNEFCQRLQSESWTVRRDEKAKVPYAFKHTDWVSYDDHESITTKVEYALSLNLGGVMVWSIETDDFHGLCGDGEFPLLRTINKALRAASESIPSVSSSTPVPTTSAPNPTTSIATESSIAAEVPSTTISPSSSSTTETNVCKEEGFTYNPKDCSSYYVCVRTTDDSLVAFKFYCPNTLYWDRTNLNCNYHEYIECSVS